jgi:hypothetical protein
VAARFDHDPPQVLLGTRWWRIALRRFEVGTVALALDTGNRLSELIALAAELRRFDSVELLCTPAVDPKQLSDLVALYESHGLRVYQHSPDRQEPSVVEWATPSALKRSDLTATHPGTLLGSWAKGLRVGFLGTLSLNRLGMLVRRLPIDPSTATPLPELTDGWLNLLMVDESLANTNNTRRLANEARQMGAQTVLVCGGLCHTEGYDGFDLHIEKSATSWVHPSSVSPFGYVRVVEGRLAVVGSLSAGSEGSGVLAWLEELTSSEGVDFFGPVMGVDLPEGVRVFDGGFDQGLVERLRPYLGVVDHPGLHQSTEHRAEVLVGLAAAGVPVVADGVDNDLTALIGDPMTSVLASGSLADLKDPEARDQLSVRLRRLGLSTGTQAFKWREITGSLGLAAEPLPKVSVILTTNRPDYVEQAIGQVKAQTYPETELVLVLHGDQHTHTDQELETFHGSPFTVVRVPSKVVYGEAINRGVAASTGSLIAKMDDDDWYSPQHLWDLVHAMDYSGADLVGKAAEYVYLEELDITIRRMVNGSETYGNRNLGGGTFLIKRTTLNNIGGWRRVRINEDRGMIEDVMAVGTIYRTFGHGYLLNRRPGGHTWTADTDYFLEQASSQLPGCAVDWATR